MEYHKFLQLLHTSNDFQHLLGDKDLHECSNGSNGGDISGNNETSLQEVCVLDMEVDPPVNEGGGGGGGEIPASRLNPFLVDGNVSIPIERYLAGGVNFSRLFQTALTICCLRKLSFLQNYLHRLDVVKFFQSKV